jgi:Contractile injection system tube protein/LysM domain
MMKAKLVNKMMPLENVEFDFNPEKVTLQRSANMRSNATGSQSGGTGGIFSGAAPRVLRATGYMVGDSVKDNADLMHKWMDPGGGLLGKVAGAALGALTGGRVNLTASLPTLLFIWGPFLMECQLTSLSVEFQRFDSSGKPIRSQVTFQIQEKPSLLGLLPTNPTSGGLPGRQTHTVTQGESLPLIAARTYGSPGAWRAIADVNRIEDPFRLRPGQAIYLPNPTELKA